MGTSFRHHLTGVLSGDLPPQISVFISVLCVSGRIGVCVRLCGELIYGVLAVLSRPPFPQSTILHEICKDTSHLPFGYVSAYFGADNLINSEPLSFSEGILQVKPC